MHVRIHFLWIFLALLVGINAHSYLTNPISRSNQKETQSGCRGPACLGPCDRSKAQATRAPVSIRRGDSISVEWPRNNHAGGFIRLAWSRFSDSDSHSSFDSNVQVVVCHEVGGCGPDDSNNPNGGDSGASDGSVRPCKTSITVPPHLSDGTWTLQWAWFGGAFALGDYYSCVDYNVAGGPTGAAPTPYFQGGDWSYPGQQKCKYFNTDRLHYCINEPCENPLFPGERSGAPSGISSGTGQSSTTSVRPVTSGNRPITSGRAPVTSGSGSRATTGRIASTTGSNPPVSTTGSSTSPPGRPVGYCPNLNASNVNGDILTTSRCGSSAPDSRCADGQCCSSYGYCGPVKDSNGNYYEWTNGAYTLLTEQQATDMYCTNNQGDWRYIPCNVNCSMYGQCGGNSNANFSITVRIMVSVNTPPGNFDARAFILGLANSLKIPVDMIRDVEIRLDLSTDRTVVVFTLVSYANFDPIATAQLLRQMSTNQSPELAQNGLSGLRVEDTNDEMNASTIVTSSFIAILLGFAISSC